MFRSFMTVPAQLIANDTTPDAATTHDRLLNLPLSVLDLIFDELDVLDRAALALTCKTLLTLAHRNEHLDYIIQFPPNEHRLQHFFEVQLGRGWIPPDLAYCPDCGRFVPTNEIHWRYVSEKRTRELSGSVAGLWRERREDGWLRYWIERWCGESGTNAQGLTQADITRLICPKCAILNPETNDWRLKRLQARNERHAGSRQRLKSPGLLSPDYLRVGVNPSPLNQSFI